MNTKNNIVAFALVGLAAGTIAWLLMGTKDGRKQLNRAGDGLRHLSETIRNNTKKGVKKASELANRAAKEIDELRAQAKSTGKTAINKADQAAKKAVNNANQATKETANKVDSAIKTARRKAQKV